MKNYKYLNSTTGRTTIVTETGKQKFTENKQLNKQMKLLYECDEKGNRIDGQPEQSTKEESIEEIFDLNKKENGNNEPKPESGEETKQEISEESKPDELGGEQIGESGADGQPEQSGNATS